MLFLSVPRLHFLPSGLPLFIFILYSLLTADTTINTATYLSSPNGVKKQKTKFDYETDYRFRGKNFKQKKLLKKVTIFGNLRSFAAANNNSIQKLF